MDALKDALARVTLDCYHFYALPNVEPPYIIWKEDGRTDLVANGEHTEKAWTGVVDLYTKTENDPLVGKVEDALTSVCAAWSLISVDYESDTERLHYSWDWEL